jgi:hypothetical protein
MLVRGDHLTPRRRLAGLAPCFAAP